jgi:hypothetical protein
MSSFTFDVAVVSRREERLRRWLGSLPEIDNRLISGTLLVLSGTVGRRSCVLSRRWSESPSDDRRVDADEDGNL